MKPEVAGSETDIKDTKTKFEMLKFLVLKGFVLT